ncbi:multicopper oxidase family protein [Pyxidicoccus fallax]|uniref:Multicopper oxidase family protein n=1 Tax=Pyxidicoccus fallax TaxID=394095 RepID=A0A848LVN2_9BACT|nr:multicopper oxidase family protein [Pyxidicoccus fallax]NMO22075.1 multicopper oxidase family protein [Pyxidicoccus fallax]NPC83595.1 multicopper oxidase family protein [Pyxidicoccus fallax]
MAPALLAVALAAGACRPRDKEPPQAARALREFTGAYPLEARPNGTVRSFDIVAEPTEVELVDGQKLRVWAYNGQVPGPQLRIRLGETLRVRFTNRLPQETTIHWHGVRLPNAMDGVPHTTQRPVQPGETFVYEFTPKDAGTFWFHPHVRSSEQVERGLYGLLIVEDTAPPPYSRDVVWVVDDWLLDETGQVFPRFNTRHDLAHDGRWGNVLTVNGRTDTVLRVRPGERIRLRLLNSANGRVVMPDFSGLDAKLIAVDGLYLREPIDPAGFELAPGNRIDLDITFNQNLAAPLPIVDRFSARRPNVLAHITTEGEPVTPPAFASPARAHVPAWSEGLHVPEHHAFRLNARRGGPFGIEWTLDDKAFAGHSAHHEPALTLTSGRFYRLRFVNESARLHPLHLHGMFFRLLARDGTPVEEPFFRDTVLVHGNESVDIALVPTDAGSWMLHCHILEHAEAGMMTLIAVRAP